MNIGLYMAFLGMNARQRTLDAQANNIANSSTTGYKAEKLYYTAVEAERKGKTDKQNLVAGVLTSGSIDFTQGSIQQTGRNLDLAIESDGFLQIQTQRGARFTRAGNLSMNANGQIVTKNGDLVVGQTGPITVPQGKGEISIGIDGSLAVGGQIFDKLKVVRFNNPTQALTKEGDSLFLATGSENPQDSNNPQIMQGSLENSNINSITEMVAMINNNREFESLQKSITTLMNDLGKKIAGEIGRV